MCNCFDFHDFGKFVKTHRVAQCTTILYRRAILNGLSAAVLARIDDATQVLGWYSIEEMRHMLPNGDIREQTESLIKYCNVHSKVLNARCNQFTREYKSQPAIENSRKYIISDRPPAKLVTSAGSLTNSITWCIAQLTADLAPLVRVKCHADPQSVVPANLVQMLHRLLESCRVLQAVAAEYYTVMSRLSRYNDVLAAMYCTYISRAADALYEHRYCPAVVPACGLKRKYPVNMYTPPAKRARTDVPEIADMAVLPPVYDDVPEIATVPVLSPAHIRARTRVRAQTTVPEFRRMTTRSCSAANRPVSARTRSHIVWSR